MTENGSGTQAVYETGCLFYSQLEQTTKNKRARNARLHIGTVILPLLTPCTALYLFDRLGQTRVIDKFLFNCLTSMLRSSKLANSELLTYYDFVRTVMTPCVADYLYDKYRGDLLVGGQSATDTKSCFSRTKPWRWALLEG